MSVSPKSRPLIIGLIGGVASGKSHLAQAFSDALAPVLDADRFGHEVLTDPNVIKKLITTFGPSIQSSDGQINRKSLGQLVFDAEDQRRKLEEIVHPEIERKLFAELTRLKNLPSPPKAIVIDAPLLIEAGWLDRCDTVVFVDTPTDERQRRAMERGWSLSEFHRREAAQLELESKRQAATHIISGLASEFELRRFVAKFIDAD